MKAIRGISILIWAFLLMTPEHSWKRADAIAPTSPSMAVARQTHGSHIASGLNKSSNTRDFIQNINRAPVTFEANQGQTDPQVKFLARGLGYNLFLLSTEAVLEVSSHPGANLNQRGKASVLRMRLVGANSSADAEGIEPLPGKANYFRSNNPENWHTNIPRSKRVHYRDVYQGVDLIYYGNQRQLEYDFIVKPGANPSDIALLFSGDLVKHEKPVRITENGDLALMTTSGEVYWRKPIIHQEVGGIRKEIAGEYVLKAEAEIGFQLGAYDCTKQLTIDPILTYSTFLGGNEIGAAGLEVAYDIAVDSSGCAYVTGMTEASDFPTTIGAFQYEDPDPGGDRDVYVTKLSPDGSSMIYSTYLGGWWSNWGYAIAVDDFGNAYVAGETSVSFPIVGGFQTEVGGGHCAFLAKLSPGGDQLLYSTFMGSASDNGPGFGVLGVACDDQGIAWVTGFVQIPDFPTKNAFQPEYKGGMASDPDPWLCGGDAFVARVDTKLTGPDSLLLSTYLGGGKGEQARDLALDASGAVYVSGFTASQDFPITQDALQPTHGGHMDAFLTKINSAGQLVYSTFLGGSSWDDSYGIDLDSEGSCYLTGTTRSLNFPVTPEALKTDASFNDLQVYVAKLSTQNMGFVYSTFLGSNYTRDQAQGISVNAAGEACVTGYVDWHSGFPTVEPLQASPQGGEYDGFVSKLSADGKALLFSTYLGGSADWDWPWAIDTDANGSIYVVGHTNSANFPTTPGALQQNMIGPSDAFVTKIAFFLPVTIDIKPGDYPNTINLGSGGTVPVAILSTPDFDARAVDPTSITLADSKVKLKGKGTPMASFVDVNTDGLLDLLVHVVTETLQFTDADTEAILQGSTFNGQPIRGVDMVRIIR